ncbi:MAG: hypothetical protein ACYCPW_02575 [Nitrososphaerales archaeon]
MASRKSIASYVAIAAILAASAFVIAFSFQILPFSNAARQTTTTIAFSGTPPQNCLYEIPANASVTLVPASSNTSIPEWVVCNVSFRTVPVDYTPRQHEATEIHV